jgi:hypothetical protein
MVALRSGVASSVRTGVVEGEAERGISAGIGVVVEVVELGDEVRIASPLFVLPLLQLVRLCLFSFQYECGGDGGRVNMERGVTMCKIRTLTASPT